MAAPASEELRELERLLVVAAETDEPLTVAALQEELGLGHGQVSEMLEVLREHGKAVEADVPGMWRGPMAADEPPAVESEDRVGEDGRVRVHVGAPDPDEDRPMPLPDLAESPSWLTQPTVRLTHGIASALDAPALGALVKAGIDEAHEAGEPFVLEVVS